MGGAPLEAPPIVEFDLSTSRHWRPETDRTVEGLALGGVRMLTVEDVLSVYAALTQDFADSADPISPAGVRDQGLLESAVYRQETGFGGRLKYDHPLLSAASLAYGLCCDHPFHNGNKRAALVSMLVHIDRNDYV